jgi:hypothetical protein
MRQNLVSKLERARTQMSEVNPSGAESYAKRANGGVFIRPAGAAEPALPGRRRSGPRGGGRALHAVSNRGGQGHGAGPPRARPAPSGGRELREASERVGQGHGDGPPQARPAPSGGRALHAVSNRGGRLFSAGLRDGGRSLQLIFNARGQLPESRQGCA